MQIDLQDPATPLWGICPKASISYYRDTRSFIFIGIPFIMARKWKQPISLSTNEWIMKKIDTFEEWDTIQLLRKK